MTVVKGQHISMTNDRAGTVEDVIVVPAFDDKHDKRRRPKPKPRVLVRLDNKPTMVVKVAMSQVVA